MKPGGFAGGWVSKIPYSGKNMMAIFWLTPRRSDSCRLCWRKIRPAAIWVPFVADSHRDHLATNRILRDGLMSCGLDLNSICVYSYEVWSMVPPGCYSVIDREFERKSRDPGSTGPE